MPKSVRIRAQYRQPFDQRKFIVALLTLARLRLEAEERAKQTAQPTREDNGHD